jgi:hypothetical protein
VDLLLEGHQWLEATSHNTVTKVKTHANQFGSFMDKLAPSHIFLQALRLYNCHSTILKFFAIASAVGDWTDWIGCVMRKGLELYITLGCVSKTNPAGTFIQLTVLNCDVHKERISRILEKIVIISINCSQFFNKDLLKHVLCLVYRLPVRPRHIILESLDSIISIVTRVQTGQLINL